MWVSPLHMLMIGIVILVLYGGSKITPRKPPTHPLPATSPLENSRGVATPKERPWHLSLPELLRSWRRVRAPR